MAKQNTGDQAQLAQESSVHSIRARSQYHTYLAGTAAVDRRCMQS